jgi:hypothetical protein
MSESGKRKTTRRVLRVRPGVEVLEDRWLLACNVIGGFVYVDANDNAQFDDGETSLAGSVMELRDAGGAVIATATTNAKGYYEFATAACLEPGEYTVVQKSQPVGFKDGKESAQGVSIAASSSSDKLNVTLVDGDLKQNNFGELPRSVVYAQSLGSGKINFTGRRTADLAGCVYADDNNDGQKDDGERGIAGVAVRVTGVDNFGKTVNLLATTAADGTFMFLQLQPGVYQLQETQPAGYLDGMDTAGTHGGVVTNDSIASITLAGRAQAKQYLFGELRPASLSGYVYEDRNNDGIRDPAEPGIADVLIRLSGIDDLGNAISLETRTISGGSYRFDNLRPGLYVLSEVQPPNYNDGKETPGTVGGDAGVASIANTARSASIASATSVDTASNDEIGPISLSAGDEGEEYNFGEIPKIPVGPGGGGGSSVGSGKINFTGGNDPRRSRR